MREQPLQGRQREGPLQFSLRSLFIATTACAVLAMALTQQSIEHWLTAWVAWLILAVLSHAIGESKLGGVLLIVGTLCLEVNLFWLTLRLLFELAG